MNSAILANSAFTTYTPLAGGLRTEPQAESCEEEPALRMALRYRELLKVPKRCSRLRIVSGIAWVSLDGQDHILEEGGCLSISGARSHAVISALRGKDLLFELS